MSEVWGLESYIVTKAIKWSIQSLEVLHKKKREKLERSEKVEEKGAGMKGQDVTWEWEKQMDSWMETKAAWRTRGFHSGNKRHIKHRQSKQRQRFKSQANEQSED